jgi:signal recognition particle subunit SRP54
VPIKFIGTGETLDRLEPFRPEGLASRILGMGDVVGLVRDFEAVVDAKQAEADAERLLKGRFTMADLLQQLRTLQKLGPLRDVLAKLPMFGGLADQVEGGELRRVEAMIQSMTVRERERPEIVDKSRAARIARGSGRRTKEVLDLVERFGQMRDLMASFGSGGGLLGRIPGLGRLAGAGAPGFDPAALLAGAQAGQAGRDGGGGRRESSRRSAADKRKRKQARKDRKKGRRR